MRAFGLLHRTTGAGTRDVLRLADPDHPARHELDEAVAIVDRDAEVHAAVLSTSTALLEAIPHLDAAIEATPEDLDVLVAKAAVLAGGLQFASAEEVVDAVLARDSDHFEARTWKEHWSSWKTALAYPAWSEDAHDLHPVMSEHLGAGHRLQIVRDGLQKTLAIVIELQGPPVDRNAKLSVDWILSRTLAGPLVAYYTRIKEGSRDPSLTEAFLPIFEPSAFAPFEGTFLVRQLGFSPYCFVVLADTNHVRFNRRLVYEGDGLRKVHELAAEVAATTSWLPQERFREAMQWHMDHFDMERMTFT